MDTFPKLNFQQKSQYLVDSFIRGIKGQLMNLPDDCEPSIPVSDNETHSASPPDHPDLHLSLNSKLQ